MTSPSSKDRQSASDPPAGGSAVRPTRTTVPGPSAAPPPLRASAPAPVAPARTTEPGPASAPERADPTVADLELALDVSELERVSLLELPALARYGRYELLGRLAYGGMAEIFLAREAAHASAHRMLVIKRVLPHVAEDQHFVDMFVDEARLAMQLNHPNICHVYSFGQEEGTYYIAMEWVNGKPLSKIIRNAREQGGLPIPVALKIIAQVADALDYAHRACDAKGEPLGIVHRDVSPQNIMVSYDGAVKLLDFGIAKASSHSTRTEAGVIKGKFAYMSPQQCVGEPIDGRADVFALGVCLFEALTGKNPFRRKTEFETMTMIVGDPTPSARERRPELSEEVEAIIEKALMKQPELRYQSAGEMQLAIEGVIAKLGVVVSGSRMGEHLSRLFVDDVRDGPQLDMRMSVSPRLRGGMMSADDSKEVDSAPRPRAPGSTELDAVAIPASMAAPRQPKRSALGPIAIGLALLALAGIAGAGGLLAWTMMAAPEVATTEPAVAPPVATTAPEPPPPVAPPPSAAGSVFIDSTPPGASIQMGDRAGAGVTPLEIGMVAPGTYALRLTREGYEDWSGQVEVTAGQRAAITAELERRERERPPAAAPGQLSLNTQPWSKVYLGSRLLGTTPIGRVSVPSGTARLRLVDRDGNEHRRTVRVPAGGHVTQSFNLRE